MSVRDFMQNLLGAFLAALACLRTIAPVQGAEDYAPPPLTGDGFAVPQPGRRFEFPADHGSHPEFKVEWWYVTGHLFDDGERHFGFQATFFRFAGPKNTHSTQITNSSPLFEHGELHLAHMALLDVKNQKFIHQEHLNRTGWDAAASTNTLAVRNGNWSMRLADESATHQVLTLHGSVRGDAAFALELRPTKPLVVFGTNGVSRKGADPTAASYYLTFPRLQAAGHLTVNGEGRPVHGEAWMDHEISSSQLGPDQAGWDWASLQLKDGREIMTYRMRRKDGGTDPFSTLAWIDRSGKVTHRASTEFTWTPRRTWKSKSTGAVYPIAGQLRTIDPENGRPATFSLEPLCPAQEINDPLGGVAYWEGACRVTDEAGRELGSAYVELTGYAGSLPDRLQ